MTCEHCVTTVRAAVRGVVGVREATVDLVTGLVVVESDGPVARADLEAAVGDAGYTLARG
jgi:copper chaperone CopZ